MRQTTLEAAAEAGDAVAAYLLGTALDKSGAGTQVAGADGHVAREWSAGQNDTNEWGERWWAEFVEAVPGDTTAAQHWIRKAAEQGYASAQRRMGAWAMKGQYGPCDRDQAILWFTRAARQGDSRAMHNLGFLHKDDVGSPRFSAAAVDWYRQGADAYDTDAEPGDKEGALACMSELACAAEEQGALEEAIEWWRRAMERGSLHGKLCYALRLLEGKGVEADTEAAMRLLHEAAEAGHSDAQGVLGIQYCHGDYVEADQAEGMNWLEKSAAGGSKYGQRMLESRRAINAMFDRHGMAWFRSTGEIRDGKEVVEPIDPPGETE